MGAGVEFGVRREKERFARVPRDLLHPGKAL